MAISKGLQQKKWKKKQVINLFCYYFCTHFTKIISLQLFSFFKFVKYHAYIIKRIPSQFIPGIHIKDSDLIDLSGWAFGGRKGIYLSPGGCDEFIRIFALEKNVEETWIEDLRGKRTGEEGTDEVIVLDVIELERIGRVCNDAKSLTAVMLYESYLREKKGEA